MVRVLIDGAGHKWFGTEGMGVSEFDGSVWTTYTTADGLASNYVEVIAIDGAGHMWFGHGWRGAGVSKFDGSTWTTYTTADGLADNRVRAIIIDGAGHKWFGTSGGVSEFDGSTWTTYTTTHGLASNYVSAIANGQSGAQVVRHRWWSEQAVGQRLDYLHHRRRPGGQRCRLYRYGQGRAHVVRDRRRPERIYLG